MSTPTRTATPSATPSTAKPGPTQPSVDYIIPGGTAATGNETIYNLPTGTNPFTYPGGLPQGAGGPNDPNYTRPTNGSTTDNSGNIGMIVGITVAGVAVLAMVGLLVQRFRTSSRTNTLNSHQTRSRPKHNQTGELDQTGHPRYKSDSDARNHPYYGDRTPGLIEYELSDTSGQKYGPSSVAERKRYVEQQQRKVMDEYEMFNPHRDQPPPSPYPASQSSAPSYMTAAPL
ncbi:hypothetical protein BGZ92_010610, partial [Podila epicladia]